MNKTGKVIIPANPNRYYPSSSVGFQWSDGVITNTYYTEVNKDGVPTKGGGYEWSFVELYDYSGKLIKKLDGYRLAVPLGGGYTLAAHQLNEGEIIEYLDTAAYERHWTVFDRNGNIVVDNAAKNDYYVLGGRADGYGYGYANGYVILPRELQSCGYARRDCTVLQRNAITCTKQSGKDIGKSLQNYLQAWRGL
jgi:hypothetical protein